MEKRFDCTIIGAGVAGITAAIYLKRWNFNIILLEKNMPGGSINNTSSIENYPGFQMINGSELAMNLYDQIKKLDIPYQYANVKEIKKEEEHFLLKTETGDIIADNIIIATGRTPKMLGLKNEKNLIGNGISTCAICDGPLYKDKNVCIVGGGNSALEESIYLSRICKNVTIINRSNQLRADVSLQKRIQNISNIHVCYNSKIIELQSKEGKLSSIIIQNEEQNYTYECDGLFIYIGFDPIYPKIDNLKLDNNYIVVNNKMETNIKNIYACGDIIKKDLYQIITAASEGAIAANSIKMNFNKSE